jgi:beta-lactamase regulating signal transducer with metallopeptidase domain
MAPTFLLDVVLRVSVLLAITAGLTWLLHRQSAAVRHLIWATAITAALVLPVLSLAVPKWQLSVLPASVSSSSDPQPVGLVQTTAPASSATMPTEPAFRSTARSEVTRGVGQSAQASEVPRAAPGPWQWTLTLWAIGFALVVMHLAVGTMRMWWLARRARPAVPGSWLVLAQHLGEALGVRSRVVFLEGGPSAMPMTWGLWSARVLLPDSASEWPADRQRVVLLHELAHVKRRDCLTQLLAQIACAVYWFNPLMWMAARRLRAERERACDDLVLACGTRGSDYADHLLEIARSLRSAAMPTWAAVAMAHRSQLEGRLMAILDPDVPRRSPTRRRSVAFAVAASVFVAPVALITPVPRAASLSVDGSSQPILPAAAVQAPAPQPATAPAPQPARSPAPQPAPAPLPPVGAIEPRPALAAAAAEAVREALPDLIADLQAEGWIGDSVAGVIRAMAPTLAQAVGDGVAGGVSGGISGGIRGGLAGGIEGGVTGSLQAVLAGEGRVKTPPDPRIVAALVEAMKDSDADVREHALQALARMRAPEALGAIRGALTDARPSVREQAAFALGQYRDGSSIDALAGALKDENASVREQAAFALGQIRDRRAVDPLIGSLSDQSASVREQAAFALGQLRDPRAIDALTTALKDASPDVRQQAAFALGQLAR